MSAFIQKHLFWMTINRVSGSGNGIIIKVGAFVIYSSESFSQRSFNREEAMDLGLPFNSGESFTVESFDGNPQTFSIYCEYIEGGTDYQNSESGSKYTIPLCQNNPTPCSHRDIIASDGQLIECCGNESIEYYTSYGFCGTSLGVTIKNIADDNLVIIVHGDGEGQGVGDDVLFDGIVFQDNEHYFWWFPYSPCWGWLHSNRPHKFNYTKTLSPGESFLIQGRDNGFGGSINISIDVTK